VFISFTGPSREIRVYKRVTFQGLTFTSTEFEDGHGSKLKTNSGFWYRWLNHLDNEVPAYGTITRIFTTCEYVGGPPVAVVDATYVHYMRDVHGLPLVEVVLQSHRDNQSPLCAVVNFQVEKVMYWPMIPPYERELKGIHKDVRTAPVGTQFYVIRKVRAYDESIPGFISTEECAEMVRDEPAARDDAVEGGQNDLQNYREGVNEDLVDDDIDEDDEEVDEDDDEDDDDDDDIYGSYTHTYTHTHTHTHTLDTGDTCVNTGDHHINTLCNRINTCLYHSQAHPMRFACIRG
jgi:hypothetical protein